MKTKQRYIQERTVLFQLPIIDCSRKRTNTEAVEEAVKNFNWYEGREEGIILYGICNTSHSITNSEHRAGDRFNPKEIERSDAVVILADETYTQIDLDYSLNLYRRLKDKKPFMIFCSTEEGQFYNGRYPPRYEWKDGKSVEVKIPAEFHPRFELLKTIKEAERDKVSGNYPIRTRFPNYPGKCTDPEYYFLGFENVGQAFSNEIGSCYRNAFLRYGKLNDQQRKWLGLNTSIRNMKGGNN